MFIMCRWGYGSNLRRIDLGTSSERVKMRHDFIQENGALQDT